MDACNRRMSVDALSEKIRDKTYLVKSDHVSHERLKLGSNIHPEIRIATTLCCKGVH